MLSKIFNTKKGRHIWPERTICEVHRELYDFWVLGRYEEMLPKLEEVYLMGIKLVKKLVEYKCSLPQWANNNSKESRELRKLRTQLTKELDEISNSV